MYYSSITPAVKALILSVSVMACGGRATVSKQPDDEKVTSLAISPDTVSATPGEDIQLTATATFEDGSSADVTADADWQSSDEAVVLVSDSGLATLGAAGGATVTAVYGGKEATASLTSVGLDYLELFPDAASMPVGTSQAFVLMAHHTDSTSAPLLDSVVWSTDHTDVAMVDDSGVVTALQEGTTVLSAAFDGQETTASITVVAAAVSSIDIDPDSIDTPVGYTLQLTATGTYTDNSDGDITNQVTWESADIAIATVDAAGLVRGVGVGSVSISAQLDGVSASITANISAAVITSLEISPAQPSLAAGTTLKASAIATLSDGSVTDVTTQVAWVSNDEEVFTVDQDGTITAVSVGSDQLTATVNDVSRTVTVTVTDATLTAIEVTPVQPSLPAGEQLQLKATGIFTDSSTQDLTTQVTWESDDETIATMSASGLLAAMSEGSTAVHATFYAEGGSLSGSTAVTVTAATLQSIEVSPSNPQAPVGTRVEFSAIGHYSDGTTRDVTDRVTWSSDDTAVATVSNEEGSEGVATAVEVGVAVITPARDTLSGQATLTVTDAVLEQIEISPVNASAAAGTTRQYSATGLYSDGTTRNLTNDVVWSSSNSDVATISNAQGSKGLASAFVEGTTSIGATYNNISASTTLTVTAAALSSIDVEPQNTSIALGTTQQYIATGYYTDGTSQDLTTQVTWTSSDTSVAAISNADDSKGLATSIDEGTTTITATLGETSATAVLTVTGATLEEITVTPVNPRVALGNDVQFTAVGTFSDGSNQDLTASVTWASSNTTIATISNATDTKGLATTLDAGETNISASLGEVEGSTVLTVTGATLVSITVTPEDISLPVGGRQRYIATGHYSDESTEDITDLVQWNSSEPAVATISNQIGSKGEATAQGPGSTDISATRQGITGATTLTVSDALLVSITVSPADATMALGSAQQYTATGHYDDSSTADLTSQVTWSSSDTEVATVSNWFTPGQVTARDVGEATIMAVLGDIEGETQVTVTELVLIEIKILPQDVTLPATQWPGGLSQQQFTAIAVFDDDGEEVEQDVTLSAAWASSNPGVATVGNTMADKGLATAWNQGTTLISATWGGEVGDTTLTVTPE